MNSLTHGVPPRGPMRSRYASLLLAAAFLALAPACSAQTTPYDRINAEAAKAAVTETRLRDNIGLLQGAGGNIGAITTPGGTLLVDTGIAVSKDKILGAIARLGGGPVRLAVNTHWHWDHADGNGWVRAAGGHIFAQPQTIAHLGDTIRIVEWAHIFTPHRADELPDKAVRGATELAFGGQTVSIAPYPLSHTDGDLIVHIKPADVLFTGDVWWNGMYPFIDYVAGGGVDGMIRAADWTIGQAGPRTIIVPGHGPAGGLAEITAYRDMLVTVRGRVAALKAAGKSLAETVAARPTADLDGRWGNALIGPDLFVALVYRGV